MKREREGQKGNGRDKKNKISFWKVPVLLPIVEKTLSLVLLKSRQLIFLLKTKLGFCWGQVDFRKTKMGTPGTKTPLRFCGYDELIECQETHSKTFMDH